MDSGAGFFAVARFVRRIPVTRVSDPELLDRARVTSRPEGPEEMVIPKGSSPVAVPCQA